VSFINMRKRRSGFYDPEGPIAVGCAAIIAAVLLPVAFRAGSHGAPVIAWCLYAICIVLVVGAIGFAVWENWGNFGNPFQRPNRNDSSSLYDDTHEEDKN
jgi:hypothetical protein